MKKGSSQKDRVSRSRASEAAVVKGARSNSSSKPRSDAATFVREEGGSYTIHNRTGAIVSKKTQGAAARPVEVAATVRKDGTIRVAAASLAVLPKGKVRILIVPDSPAKPEAEMDRDEWLQFLVHNPAFDFLKDPAEDIYTIHDGKPYRAEE